MKKILVLAALVAAGSAAVPSPAAAGAANCRQDSAQLAECQTLATCRLVGAGIFNYASAEEAVTFTRRCLGLDRRYRLADLSSGRSDAIERPRRLLNSQSELQALYCLAVRRAGQTDARICRARRSPTGRGSQGGGGGGGGGGAPDSGTREPSFTG